MDLESVYTNNKKKGEQMNSARPYLLHNNFNYSETVLVLSVVTGVLPT